MFLGCEKGQDLMDKCGSVASDAEKLAKPITRATCACIMHMHVCVCARVCEKVQDLMEKKHP